MFSKKEQITEIVLPSVIAITAIISWGNFFVTATVLFLLLCFWVWLWAKRTRRIVSIALLALLFVSSLFFYNYLSNSNNKAVLEVEPQRIIYADTTEKNGLRTF